MTADEIRSYGVGNVNTEFYEMAELLRELTAQSAESNESRKPRWVDISNGSEPYLIDASRVIALTSEMSSGKPCVYVHLRGSVNTFIAFDTDCDAVRFKLGIGEDWMQTPAPVAQFDWHGANAMAFSGRVLIGILRGKDSENTTQALEVLEAAIDSWEDVPF